MERSKSGDVGPLGASVERREDDDDDDFDGDNDDDSWL